RLVGEGGMALVYEIRRADGADEGPLALKVLKIPHRSIQRRLITEGKAQGRLTHPNVVSVKAIVEVEGSPGLVMELVEGIDLDVLLNRGRLEVEAVDQLAVPIIEGVAAAHEAGLIHRDLKPANVLLAGAPGAWVPKIADFGIARIVDSGDDGARATRTGMAMGTPSFMAPEQIRNAKDTDARADVY
ncbi:MAG: serine/threonine protein kinase, partial [Myxococcales bacterium]|nr:serine/threonine protein kinase [Myxococcales bacterium]